MAKLKESKVWFRRVFNTQKLQDRVKDHPQRPTLFTLASAVQVSPPTLRKYLDGGDVPLSTALKLCKILDVPYELISDLWRPL